MAAAATDGSSQAQFRGNTGKGTVMNVSATNVRGPVSRPSTTSSRISTIRVPDCSSAVLPQQPRTTSTNTPLGLMSHQRPAVLQVGRCQQQQQHQPEEQWRTRQLARLQLRGNSAASSCFAYLASSPPKSSPDNGPLLRQRAASATAAIAQASASRMSPVVSKAVKIPTAGRVSAVSSSTADEVEATERMKTKLLSVWNNVKYGWTVRMKTNFSRATPIWFLGQCYHHKFSDDDGDGTEPSGLAYGMDGFKQDFISRIWFTYRREFPTLAGSAYSTDCGWGCMLRSGQMMLVQALLCHFLGRGWRWQSSSHHEEAIHRRIVRWFADWPSRSSPFSIHRLVNFGEVSGKRAGDWYGPASVAHIMRQSLEQSAQADPLLGELCVYVAQDCTVYKPDVLKLCSGTSSKSSDSVFGLRRRWRGVVILVPVRLGGETLNPIYFKCVQAILSNEYCIGIIGGRPRHSLYFVGWQEDKLIHLDPHYCQEAVDVTTSDFPLQSFHCMSPRKLSFSRMDPSCTIGFYCRTENDVLKFLASCNEVLTPPRPQSDYPVFVVAECSGSDQERASYSSLVQSLGYEQSFSRCISASEEQPTSDIASEDEDYEEFVFL